MDYELFEELKWQIENRLREKENTKEVLQSLVHLINHVTEFHLEDKESKNE